MKRKLLVTALTSVALATGISAVVPSIPTTVQAAKKKKVPKFNSKYWDKTRTIYIKKKVKIQKIQYRKDGKIIPGYKQKAISTRYLKRGTKVKVKNGGASWRWILQGTIPKIGKANTHSYFWTVPLKNTNWISLSKVKASTKKVAKNQPIHQKILN